MRRPSKVECATVLLWTVFLFPSAVGQAQEPAHRKQVLVLYWEDNSHPANVDFTRSLRGALQSLAPGRIEYYAEYLEPSRFPGKKQSELLRNYILEKYAGRTIDVVVASEAVALDFLLKYRNDLFPNTPIVFSANYHPSSSQLMSGAGATGVIYVTGYRKTVELALKLNPGTERVFIVSSTPPVGDSWEKTARNDLRGFSDAAITYFTNLPLEELIAKVRALPTRSVVLYVWVRLQNRDGGFLETRDVLGSIVPSVRVPMYGLSFANIGLGIVGGYVWTMEARTQKMAEMILKVAGGVRAADIPVENVPVVPMFDWRELERWGINEKLLPAGSVVRFRKLTFWQEYRWRIVGVGFALLLQTVLIASLLAQRRRVRRGAAALRESEERYRSLVLATSAFVWVADSNGEFSQRQPSWESYTGQSFEQYQGNGWIEAVHPEDHARVADTWRRAIASRSLYEVQWRAWHAASGQWRHCVTRGVPVLSSGGEVREWIAAVTDVHDRKMLEAGLQQEEKLASLGVLAGGVAHDFNNLLGAVLAQAELALSEHQAGMSPEPGLASIRETAMRGSEIVRQLMIYAGKEREVPGLVSVSRVVEEMLELLRVSISKRVTLETDLGGDLPAVRASAAQLGQIVMNLVINASEAIRDRNGVIRVITCSSSIGPDAASEKRLVEGDYVKLEVSDSGDGMSAETQARLFDPFFTTKLAGRGLGLAVVDGIVRGLRGGIQVLSELGKGTRFLVLLPVAKTTAVASSEALSRRCELVETPQEFTVLVVEDEQALRQAVVIRLQRAGFKVLEAANGTAATDFLSAKETKIDLILLDLNIPGVSSHEVAAIAAQLRPDLKVVLTSAYGEEIVRATSSVTQRCSFIRKPYRLAVLVQTLQNELRRDAPSEAVRRATSGLQ